MKEMGMEKVIFSKENVLMKTGKEDFYSPDVKNKFIEAMDLFGDRNIILIEEYSRWKTHHWYGGPDEGNKELH